jgi:hypothetical protein
MTELEERWSKDLETICYKTDKARERIIKVRSLMLGLSNTTNLSKQDYNTALNLMAAELLTVVGQISDAWWLAANKHSPVEEFADFFTIDNPEHIEPITDGEEVTADDLPFC